MRLGIVGAEATKFTPTTEQQARSLITSLLIHEPVTCVISGACHLGGIDVWAVEEALLFGIPVIEFPPAEHNWTRGYMPRNLQIARKSDRVVCITVKSLPATFTGRRFTYCYHCGTDSHVKSGGCWTVKQAKKLGKSTEIFVIGES
jgi:hypothetical protein